MRSRRPGQSLRRLGLVLGVGAVLIILVVTLHGFGNTDSFPVPGKATLTGLSVRQRIVAIAQSQVGYSTDPSNSYCNKFSAYWDAGTADCPSGEMSEEWCADFAAWAWQKAGVHSPTATAPERSTAAPSASTSGASPTASGTRRRAGTWLRPATWRSTASRSARPVGRARGDRHRRPARPAGPDVVNGDGDRTGFSVVETGTDQVRADAGHGDSTLAGYVSPP